MTCTPSHFFYYILIFADIKLNDALKQQITKAIELYKNTCESLDINYTIIDGIGKNLCKEHSISPDAIMQLSFQVIDLFFSIIQLLKTVTFF